MRSGSPGVIATAPWVCVTREIVGFRAALCMDHEHGKAFFISHNSDNENARYARFDALLTRALDVQTPPAPSIDAAMPVAWKGRYVPSPVRFEMFRYFDLLFESVVLDVDASKIELRKLGEPPTALTAVGVNLYRTEDRRVASHVLLSDVSGVPLLSDSSRTLRNVSGIWYALQWASSMLGLAGMLMIVIAVPWRRVQHGEPLVQPASIALLLAMLLPLFALQPLTALGDRTAASVALYGATLILPLLLM